MWISHGGIYGGTNGTGPVSYTHLDVYKRQRYDIRNSRVLNEEMRFGSTTQSVNVIGDVNFKLTVEVLAPVSYTHLVIPCSER